MPLLVEADHLSRYYGHHCAVNDIGFSLSKGQVLGFLGVNGAGKTTTMQMLCGNLAPSAGNIKINGYDLSKNPKAAKSSLGYLPDTPPLYKELTVQEFLRYCAKLHGIHKSSIRAAIDRVLQRCGLTEVAPRLIANLSKGFQQRVGIAQAILHNPDLILLDEPTVGLDPIQIREIRALIRELGQDHGIILSTHILTEVQESCTHVQIIHQGRMILAETISGLNRKMDSATLSIATRLTPNFDRLATIPGVNTIERISENRIKIHHSITANPAERVAELITSAGWGLQELMPEKVSMEDIFVSLTTKHRKQ